MGPSRENRSNCRISFYWRKVISRVWLITSQKIMSLQAREPPQNGGYACIIGFHLFTLSKLWGRFSQLQNRFIKNNRTQSVFMLQKWLTYQNIAERITNNSSALDFLFSASVFCNMDLKSNICRKTTDFSWLWYPLLFAHNHTHALTFVITRCHTYNFLSFITTSNRYMHYETPRVISTWANTITRCIFVMNFVNNHISVVQLYLFCGVRCFVSINKWKIYNVMLQGPYTDRFLQCKYIINLFIGVYVWGKCVSVL